MDEATMSNEVLRFAVGRQIFCPVCDGTLDVKTTTLLLADDSAFIRHTSCLPECFEPADGVEVITWQ